MPRLHKWITQFGGLPCEEETGRVLGRIIGATEFLKRLCLFDVEVGALYNNSFILVAGEVGGKYLPL